MGDVRAASHPSGSRRDRPHIPHSLWLLFFNLPFLGREILCFVQAWLDKLILLVNQE